MNKRHEQRNEYLPFTCQPMQVRKAAPAPKVKPCHTLDALLAVGIVLASVGLLAFIIKAVA